MIINKTPLIPSSVSKRKLPANFLKQDEAFFEKESQHTLPAVSLFEYKNVCVTYAGSVFAGFKTFLESVREDYHKTLGLKYVLYNRLRRKKIILPKEKKYILFFNNLCDCYYHWMTEAIPRLFLIKDKLADHTIILPDIYRKFQLKSLEPFGITEDKIVFIPKDTFVNVQHLIMPSFTGVEQSYHEELMQEIRDFYVSYYQYKHKDQSKAGGKKYYIRRKQSSIRHVVNEAEVIQIVQEYGFQDIFFEDYSFEEQVLMASQAQCILSIHGAGLTNTMFMPEGSTVLEFRKEQETGYLHYYTLASAMSVNYYYQFGKAEDPTISSKEANIFIDPTLLRQNINNILQQSGN